MRYTFHKNTDPKRMDAFVLASDQNSLYQSSNWAKVKKNWKSIFTSVEDEDGNIVASALVLVRRLVLNKTLCYIPKGPVMDYHNDELVSFMFINLMELAKENHAIDLKFDPNIKLRRYLHVDRDEEIEMENDELISILEDHGAKHKGFTMSIEESTQPRFNASMDLVEDWQSKLKYNTRRSIRMAKKLGVELYTGREYMHDLATAISFTEDRKNIALRSEEYFKDMYDAFDGKSLCIVAKINFVKQKKVLQEKIDALNEKYEGKELSKKKQNVYNEEMIHLTKEYKLLDDAHKEEGVDEVVTSGALVCYNDKLAEIFYAGNNPKYFHYCSSYYIWEYILKMCDDLNIPTCSFGGMEGSLDDGLAIFKSHWLMYVEEYIGEFDMVIDPVMFHMLETTYPKLRETVGKMRGNKE